jgi:chromosome segregation ATPase
LLKINELIDALNEKKRLIEKQDDLLFEECDKVVEVEKSLAIEVKKNEFLSTELSYCHSFISSLKTANDDLNARIEKLKNDIPLVHPLSMLLFTIYARMWMLIHVLQIFLLLLT